TWIPRPWPSFSLRERQGHRGGSGPAPGTTPSAEVVGRRRQEASLIDEPDGARAGIVREGRSGPPAGRHRLRDAPHGGGKTIPPLPGRPLLPPPPGPPAAGHQGPRGRSPQLKGLQPFREQVDRSAPLLQAPPDGDKRI